MINILLPSMQDVQNGVIVAIRTFLLHLCDPVYKLIVFCFQIFESFGKVRLFENSDAISNIYNRIGLILGLFLIFRITFSAISYIINPDTMFDKEKGYGGIVKKVLIVIILLGSTRFLFDAAYELQDKLIDSQIVSKILISDATVDDANSGGAVIAWTAFTTFYRINPDPSISDSDKQTCVEMTEEHGAIYEAFFDTDGSIVDSAGYCLNDVDENDINIIIFNGVFCLGVGLFLLWTIFTYTVQVAIRVIQLAYLELIAPIPIMMYLTPDGDGKLKKWGQQCLTTFLDFFIRVAIMDFIIIVSGALINFQDSLFGYFTEIETSNGPIAEMYVILIMIIALMMFAKRIPNLLQEILPSTGGAASLGFGFGLSGEAKKVGGFLGGLTGGVIGATAGGVLNAGVSALDNYRAAGNVGRNRFGAAMHGLGSGALIGIRNGAKKGNVFKNVGAGMSARKAADRNYEQLLAAGGSARGRIGSQISSHFGMTKGQEYERMRANANQMDEYVKNIRSAIEKVDAVQGAKKDYENFTPTEGMDEATAKARRAWLYQRYKDMRDGYTDLALRSDIDLNTYRDFDGNALSGHDLLYLTEARQQGTAANNFAESVHATTIDTNGQEGTFTEIKDASTLGKVGLEANTTERMIVGSDDYIRTKANDEAAGVNKTNNS